MDKIKVGLLYFGKVNAMTGVSTVLKNLQLGFEGLSGIELTILASDCDGKIDLKFTNDESKMSKRSSFIAICRLKTHKLFYWLNKKSRIISQFYAWLSYDRNALNIVIKKGNLLKEMNVLFFHDIFTPYYFRKRYQQMWDNKHKVIVMHDSGIPLKMFFDYFPKIEQNYFAKKKYVKMLETVINEANTLVFLSSYSANNFINYYPHFQSKIVVIPNGMISKRDSEIALRYQKTMNKTKIKITTVGTVSKRKGHDIIVDALAELSEDEKSKFEITIIGNGGLLNQLKQKCITNKIENIYFVGSRKDVDSFLIDTDIFLLASRDEGLPMAIIEALRWGIPVIGTNVGGIPNLIRNNNGWLIEPNVKELIKLLRNIIETPPDLQTMGKNSLELFKNEYETSKMIEGYCTVFNTQKKNV